MFSLIIYFGIFIRKLFGNYDNNNNILHNILIIRACPSSDSLDPKIRTEIFQINYRLTDGSAREIP